MTSTTHIVEQSSALTHRKKNGIIIAKNGDSYPDDKPRLINLVEMNEMLKRSAHDGKEEPDPFQTIESLAKIANVQNDKGWSFKEGELAVQESITWIEQIECAVMSGAFLGLTFIPVFITLYGMVMQAFWLIPFVIVMTILGFFPLYHPWPPMGKNWHLMHMLQKYFSMKLVLEAPLSRDKKYIFVSSPHGVFPFANMLTVPMISSTVGFGIHCLVATAVMHCPIFRHLIALLGCIDASRPVARRTLESGRSIGVTVGGIPEIFEVTKEDEVIIIKDRKGFVKLALETGAHLLPVYAFGNTTALSCIADRWGILQAISRRVRFSLTIPFGRMLLPIPYHVPMAVVCGKPIEVPHIPHPKQSELDHYHDKFLKEMQGLFDRHKAAFGWKDKRLIIA